MHLLDMEHYKGPNLTSGYTEDSISKFGVIEIEQDVLFSRIEFNVYEDTESKIVYAVSLGWRYNPTKQIWYRLRGL